TRARSARTRSRWRVRSRPGWSGSRSLPANLLELRPVADLHPLAVLHDDQAAGVAHAAALVAAVAVLEPPARVPVLDGLDGLQHGVTRQVAPGALHGLHEQRGLLIAVEVGGVDRQPRRVLGHVGAVLIEER